MAGLLTTDRAIENRMKSELNRMLKAVAVCALLAGPLAFTAKAQVVQAQTGSSTSQPPPQAQPPNPPAKPKNQDQTQQKKKEKKPPKPQAQKPIKAHVIKADAKKKKSDDAVDTTQSVEPDKILYQRAMLDVKKGRYIEGRLSLQALINTYPDSEYLAKAKLAVADSYYKEGGTSNFTQAIDEYKNFIIFFPFLDEAAYAQMQIGMGHFRMMEKSDRDTTQAIEAEQEFQTFLLKYPQSPLVPKAEQYLRGTQEVLADGEYKVARFYYLKQDYPASAARLFEVTERYPLYSQSDEALWMLGDVYDRAKRASRNEDERNHWADLAGKCYARIVQNYPLSHLSGEAKARLTAMGMPAPAVDPNAVARMQKQQLYEKEHKTNFAMRFPMQLLKTGPNVQLAAHSGDPNLNPPDDAISARDVLKQGAAGPDFNVQTRPVDQTQAGTQSDSGAPVEAVPSSPNAPPPGSNIGVQIIGSTPDPNTQPAASQTPAASTGGTIPASSPPAATSSTDPTQANPPASTGTTPPTDPSAPAAVLGGTIPPDPATPGATTGGTSGQQPTAQANGQSPAPTGAQASGQSSSQAAKGQPADSGKESSSKKKKGIKKVIPW